MLRGLAPVPRGETQPEISHSLRSYRAITRTSFRKNHPDSSFHEQILSGDDPIRARGTAGRPSIRKNPPIFWARRTAPWPGVPPDSLPHQPCSGWLFLSGFGVGPISVFPSPVL